MKHITVLGHSHLVALQEACGARAEPDGFTFVQLRNDTVMPNFRIENDHVTLHESIREAVCNPQTDMVVSVAEGNLHSKLFVVDEGNFDFCCSAAPDLPLTPGAQILPETVLREILERQLSRWFRFLKAIREQSGKPVVHYAPPPPVRDSSFIFNRAGVFARQAKGELKIASPEKRLKGYLLYCDIVKRFCEDIAIRYEAPPGEAIDEDGYLVPHAWKDATHGNPWFGEIMLTAIEQLSDRTEANKG